MLVTVIFDGKIKVEVLVDDNALALACVLFNTTIHEFENIKVASLKKECVATAMFIYRKYRCMRPPQENASYDLIINGGTIGGDRYVDIKTEYIPPYEISEYYSEGEAIMNSITLAIAKEEKDGITCAFDISYLSTSAKTVAKQFIGNRAIIIEYELAQGIPTITDIQPPTQYEVLQDITAYWPYAEQSIHNYVVIHRGTILTPTASSDHNFNSIKLVRAIDASQIMTGFQTQKIASPVQLILHKDYWAPHCFLLRRL